MHTNNHQEDNWDLEIAPQSSLLDLQLGQLWKYRDLLLLFVRRDFVANYKQTILGPLWFFIQPLLTTITFTIIFGNIAGIPTDGLPPMLFYLAGTTAWNYFSETLTSTADTFTANANIFGKVYFPRLIMPLSKVLSGLIKFGIQFMLFLGLMSYFMVAGAAVKPDLVLILLWTPILSCIMAGLGLGFGIIFSSLTTKYRDLRFLLTFGVQLLMYATPVIYPISKVPEAYRWIVYANPMSSIVELFRNIYLGAGTYNPGSIIYSALFMFVLLLIGTLIFNKVEKGFMDTV
jgi:lipopolysaccharide transport system permease protein